MPEIDFLTSVHNCTKRDYLARVNVFDKSECAVIAKQFGYDYWDGDRRFGYGGYAYDGRWRPVAEAMARHYGLKAQDKVLDIGCGKAHLLLELTRAVPGLVVAGLDLSAYAIENAPEEIRPNLRQGCATSLPWPDKEFDLVFSINVLHNLYNYDLVAALREITRTSNKGAYVCVESYRSEREKMNLLYWQLTCECFYTPKEWLWLFGQAGYNGDYGFVYHE
ncbi:MAG: class I SAM-dependent methyltransferase [Alphaproteobacteria bacterium]|nr:class I SAM-dependent methyltransferase [Alphaproteobacteria bacterium]